jgi:hypothetical protein
MIDASQPNWCVTANDDINVIVSINVIHISPWSVTKGILQGAQRFLPNGGVLYFYGPFLQNNVPTAPGNIAFDESLKKKNGAWGLRNLDQVEKLGAEYALKLDRIIEMPSNNLSVIFIKA